MKRTPILWLAMACATALTAGACSGATSDPTAGSSKDKGASLTVGVTIQQADIYFQGVDNSVESAVSPGGGSVNLVNTQADASKEATGFQNLISAQVSGIIASPLSPTGSLASVKSAAAAKIPIVCYNTCLGADSQKYAAAFIESDQVDLGTKTGQYAVTALKSSGTTKVTLGILNCNRYEACKERQTGFLGALKEGGIQVTIAANQKALSPDTGNKIATDILTGNPGINVMWSASQGPTEGMVAAVKAAGKTKSVKLFGTDVSPSLVQSVKDGDLLATTGQDSKKTGRLAIEALKKAIGGENVAPFETKIPGILYAANDKSLLDQYLANH